MGCRSTFRLVVFLTESVTEGVRLHGESRTTPATQSEVPQRYRRNEGKFPFKIQKISILMHPWPRDLSHLSRRANLCRSVEAFSVLMDILHSFNIADLEVQGFSQVDTRCFGGTSADDAGTARFFLPGYDFANTKEKKKSTPAT